MEGRRQLHVWDCVNGIRDGLVKDAVPLPDTQPPGGALAWVEKHPRGDAIFCFLDLADHAEEHPNVRRMFKDALARLDEAGGVIVTIDGRDPPPVMAGVASRFEISYPNAAELEQIVRETVKEHHRGVRPVRVEIRKNDLDAIVGNLRGLTRRQARQAVLDAVAHDQRFDVDDVQNVLAHKRPLPRRGRLVAVRRRPRQPRRRRRPCAAEGVAGDARRQPERGRPRLRHRAAARAAVCSACRARARAWRARPWRPAWRRPARADGRRGALRPLRRRERAAAARGAAAGGDDGPVRAVDRRDREGVRRRERPEQRRRPRAAHVRQPADVDAGASASRCS